MRRTPGLQQHHQRDHDQETDDDHPERPQQSEHLRLQCGFAGDEREARTVHLEMQRIEVLLHFRAIRIEAAAKLRSAKSFSVNSASRFA